YLPLIAGGGVVALIGLAVVMLSPRAQSGGGQRRENRRNQPGRFPIGAAAPTAPRSRVPRGFRNPPPGVRSGIRHIVSLPPSPPPSCIPQRRLQDRILRRGEGRWE